MVTNVQFGSVFTSGNRQVLGGSSTGYDTESLINGLVDAKRLPAVRLESRLEENAAKQAALSEFQTLLSGFRDAASLLRNPPGVQNAADNIFRYRSGVLTSSTATAASNFLGVTVAPGAALSNYTLEVDALATYNLKTTATFGLADLNTSAVDGGGPLASGTWTIGSGAIDITLDPGDTLQEVINKFNAVSEQSGVRATAIQISPGNYRLQFKSTSTGTASNYALPGGMLNVALDIDTAAVDAQFTIDGTTVTRSQNTISDVISDLTFELKQETAGAELTLNVEPDLEVVRSGILNFVDSYNALRLFVAKQTQLGEDGRPAEEAVLSSSTALRNTLARVMSEMTRSIEGLTSDPSRLSDLGITFDDFPGDDENPFTRNIMVVDEETLDSALSSDFDSVRKVFEFDFTSSDSEIQVFTRTNALDVNSFTLNIDTVGGIYQATYDPGSGPVTIDLTATSISGGGVLLTGVEGTVLEGLQLIYSGSAASTFSNITVTQGVGDRIFNSLDDVLDEDTGLVTVEIESISTSNTRIEDEIARIDEIVERFREQLLAKFSALENAIASINTILQSLQAQADAQLANS